MMEEFFEFAYLDEDKISKFLAQKNRGIVRERNIRETASTTFDAKAGAKVPLVGEIGGGAGKSSERQEGMDIESTAAGDFVRFRDFIHDQPGLSQIAGNGIPLDEIPRRGLLEVDGIIRVSPIRQILSILSQISSLPPSLFGDNPEFKAVTEQLKFVDQVFQREKIPITLNTDESHPIVSAILNDKALLIPIEEIGEEYSFLGKVIKIIKPEDKPYNLLRELFNPALSPILPSTNQEQMIESFTTLSKSLNLGPIGVEAFKLKGPLVVLSPIAIYR
jgi:hypothetical protein